MLDKFDFSVKTDSNYSFWVNAFKISGYAIDMKGRATLQVLCNFLWETAGNHAYAIHAKTVKEDSERFFQKGEFWLLSRFYIRIKEYPSWNDEIYVRTWVKGSDKLFLLRDFQLFSRDGNVIGEVTSAWILVDIASRKPRRIDSHCRKSALYMLTDCHAVKRKLTKIKPVSRPIISPYFPVLYRDLDLNNHVNNVSYINWILDEYPYEILNENEIDELEINYMSESFIGDEICVATELIPEPQLTFIHNAARKADGREVVRAKIKWRGNMKEYRRKRRKSDGL